MISPRCKRIFIAAMNVAHINVCIGVSILGLSVANIYGSLLLRADLEVTTASSESKLLDAWKAINTFINIHDTPEIGGKELFVLEIELAGLTCQDFNALYFTLEHGRSAKRGTIFDALSEKKRICKSLLGSLEPVASLQTKEAPSICTICRINKVVGLLWEKMEAAAKANTSSTSKMHYLLGKMRKIVHSQNNLERDLESL